MPRLRISEHYYGKRYKFEYRISNKEFRTAEVFKNSKVDLIAFACQQIGDGRPPTSGSHNGDFEFLQINFTFGFHKPKLDKP